MARGGGIEVVLTTEGDEAYGWKTPLIETPLDKVPLLKRPGLGNHRTKAVSPGAKARSRTAYSP